MPTAVVFAYHVFGHAGLEALERGGWRIARVLSHADRPGETVWWPSIAAWCAARGISCELDADLKDPATAARIAADRPDHLFSFYFRSMIPGRILDLAPGAWNLHGSLLPRYRGRSPVNWQLVHGERESGLTLHRMLRAADAGDVLGQVAVPVHPDQDALGLTRQLLAVAPALLDRHLADLAAGTAQPTAQDHARATVFGGRTPEDGRLDFTLPARRLHDLVRAVAPPWPGAFAFLGGQRVLFWRTAVVDTAVTAPPGTVLADGGIACGTGILYPLHLAAADGQPVALSPGDRLMSAPAETATPAEHLSP